MRRVINNLTLMSNNNNNNNINIKLVSPVIKYTNSEVLKPQVLKDNKDKSVFTVE